MNKKVKKLFLFKSSKLSCDKTPNTQPDISEINVVKEAELILDRYIASMGYKSASSKISRKSIVIAAVFSSLVLCMALLTILL